MKKLRSKLFSLFALLLGGCATTYQEEGFFTNGYSNKTLSPNTFLIAFHANEMTSPDEVVQLALRRCAQVTRDRSYRYFTVMEQLDCNSKKKVPGLHYPSVQLTIACFNERPPYISSYDVREEAFTKVL